MPQSGLAIARPESNDVAAGASIQSTEATKAQRMTRRLGPSSSLATWGYCASLVLHVVLLTVLALIVFEQTRQNPINLVKSVFGTDEGGGQNASSAPTDATGNPEQSEPDTQIPDEPIEPQAMSLPFIEAAQTEPSDITPPEVPIASTTQPENPVLAKSSAAAKGDGDGNADGNGGAKGNGGREGEFSDRFEHVIPKNGKAVIQGNFAAWTVPEDPQPNEEYKIVIQIKLPTNVKQYPLTDLAGLVEGSDTYKQPIPDSIRGFLPVVDHQTQLVVVVPGAAALIKDVIVIRSRMLGERQKLEIVF